MSKKLQIYLLSTIAISGLFVAFSKPRIDQQLEIGSALLSQQSKFVASAAQVNKLRAENIQKVLTVIDRFNPDMDAETRQSIALEISNASMKYENLDVDLICATITHETGFTWNPRIASPKGALGLMQVMPATGKFLAEVEGMQWTGPQKILCDAVKNVRLGSRYLSSLIEMYEVDGGLAAYNGGGKRAAMWLARNRASGVLFAETQNYVPAVLSLYEEFQAF